MSTPIHQEVTFQASPERVYESLMDSDRFSELTGLPATISGEVGGEFSLFGGGISGRNVELVPGRRIIQAWQARDLGDGAYSIVHFELGRPGRPDEAHLRPHRVPRG